MPFIYKVADMESDGRCGYIILCVALSNTMYLIMASFCNVSSSHSMICHPLLCIHVSCKKMEPEREELVLPGEPRSAFYVVLNPGKHMHKQRRSSEAPPRPVAVTGRRTCISVLRINLARYKMHDKSFAMA